MRVKLSSMPDPKETASLSLNSFGGGLNRRDHPGHLSSTESPDMVNLWYDGGLLRPRPGIRTVFAPSEAADGTTSDRLPAGKVPRFCDRLWNGLAVFACGEGLWWFDPGSDPAAAAFSADALHRIADADGNTALLPAGAAEQGSFFPFGAYLYYKASQIFFRLRLEEDTETAITAEPLLLRDETTGTVSASDAVYTPIIAISRSADGSVTTAYQPENRINPDKTVWFDIDGSSLDYYLPVHGCEILSVQLGDDITTDFQFPVYPDGTEGTERVGQVGSRYVTLRGEDLSDDASEYTCLHFDLPLYVDESQWTSENWNTTASQGGSYLRNVLYSSFNLPAPASISGNLVTASAGEEAAAVLAKYQEQVDTAVWRASRDYGEALLSGRFLISLAEDYLTVLLETVSGMLVTDYDSTTTEFRALGWIRESVLLTDSGDTDAQVVPSSLTANQLRVTYRKPNDDAMASIAECTIARRFGGSDAVCVVLAGSSARPDTIALCGNHLVWVSSRYGVLMLHSTSAAGENQISVLSGKVFLPAGNRKLLRYSSIVSRAEDGSDSLFTAPANAVCAAADQERYYLFGRDGAFLILDYEGTASDPDSGCWTCHSGAAAGHALVTGDAQLWLGNLAGGISLLDRSLSEDTAGAIACRYTSPTLTPGTPARTRRLRTVVLQVPYCDGDLSATVFGTDPEYGGISVTDTISFSDAGISGASGTSGTSGASGTSGEHWDPVLLRPGLRSTAYTALRLEGNSLHLRSIRLLYTLHGPNR